MQWSENVKGVERHRPSFITPY